LSASLLPTEEKKSFENFDTQIGKHFENTLSHIKVRREAGDDVYKKLVLQ
jgi:hypothetical protein